MDAISPSNQGVVPRANQVVGPGLGVEWTGPAGTDVDAISPGNEIWLPHPCDYVLGPSGNYVATIFWWSVDRAATGGARSRFVAVILNDS